MFLDDEALLLNIANYSDNSRVCLFGAVAGWIRLLSSQAGERSCEKLQRQPSKPLVPDRPPFSKGGLEGGKRL